MKNAERWYSKYFVKSFTSAFVIFIIFIFTIYVLACILVPHFYRRAKVKELNECGEMLAARFDHMSYDEIKPLMDEFVIDYNYGIVLLTENGELIYTPPFVLSLNSHRYPREDNLMQSYKGRLYINDSGNLEVSQNFWYSYVTVNASEGVCKLLITLAKKPMKDISKTLIRILPGVLISALFFSVLIAYLYARSMTRPILRVAQQARHMVGLEENAAKTRRLRSGDEVVSLQKDLNQLYRNLNQTVLELEESNEQLEKQVHKVQEMEKQRAGFFAAASHELKTPISAAIVMLEGMIDQTGCYQDRDTYLRECRKQMSKLSNLVQDILEITRLDSMKVIQKEKVDLVRCLDQTIDQFDILAERRMVTIQREYMSAVIVETDPVIFKRAVSNLLSNAVKYTPMEGIIQVRLQQEKNGYCVTVVNPGKSIDEDVLRNYTNAFARPDAPESGSGLGLYIVHHICQILGYRFTIQNTREGIKAVIYIDA